jgi:hypothetical protein
LKWRANQRVGLVHAVHLAATEGPQRVRFSSTGFQRQDNKLWQGQPRHFLGHENQKESR